MKLSFSTLACPFWSFSEVISSAKDLGFNGIEIRGVDKELYAPKIREFSDDNIKQTLVRLKKANLEIPIFTSAAYLFSKKHIDDMLNEAFDYVDLASETNVPFIRVLGDLDANITPDIEIDMDFVLQNFIKVCEYAKDKNVKVLLETNGHFADSKVMKKFLEDASCKNAGVIWDVHHTVRFFSEKPNYTVSMLGDKICHVHLKDSLIKNGKVTYQMMGSGDIPITEAVFELKNIGYNGYLSLEWVKRWAPDLSEAGIALPQFRYFMQGLHI